MRYGFDQDVGVKFYEWEDRSWMERAECKGLDPELFFGEKGVSNEPAMRVCESCVVRELCLQWALSHNETYGIWGGTSAQERKQLRRGWRLPNISAKSLYVASDL